MVAGNCLVILVSHGSTGVGESRVTVVLWHAGSYACAIVCLLVYYGASKMIMPGGPRKTQRGRAMMPDGAKMMQHGREMMHGGHQKTQ